MNGFDVASRMQTHNPPGVEGEHGQVKLVFGYPQYLRFGWGVADNGIHYGGLNPPSDKDGGVIAFNGNATGFAVRHF